MSQAQQRRTRNLLTLRGGLSAILRQRRLRSQRLIEQLSRSCGREQLDKGSHHQFPLFWTEFFYIVFQKLLETRSTNTGERIVLCARRAGTISA